MVNVASPEYISSIVRMFFFPKEVHEFTETNFRGILAWPIFERFHCVISLHPQRRIGIETKLLQLQARVCMCGRKEKSWASTQLICARIYVVSCYSFLFAAQVDCILLHVGYNCMCAVLNV